MFELLIQGLILVTVVYLLRNLIALPIRLLLNLGDVANAEALSKNLALAVIMGVALLLVLFLMAVFWKVGFFHAVGQGISEIITNFGQMFSLFFKGCWELLTA